MKTFESIKIVGEYQIIGSKNVETVIDKLCSTGVQPVCKISFQLSRRPPREWTKIFDATWHNSSFHVSGCNSCLTIASIESDKVILKDVTENAIKKFHRKTLDKVIEEANHQCQISESNHG